MAVVAIAAVVAEATAAVLLAGVGAAAIAAVARVMVVVEVEARTVVAAEVHRTVGEAGDRTGLTNFLENVRARPDLPGGLFAFTSSPPASSLPSPASPAPSPAP
jgi:hypothetical protein